jgi:hypothetical protein
MVAENEIYEVKRRHSAELLGLPGVSGVGVAKGKNGGLVIAIHVDRDDAELAERLPKQIEGFPVEAVQSGPFRKL